MAIPMHLSYERYTLDEREELIAFIVADTYPYNGVPQPTRAQVAAWSDDEHYTETFWIVRDGTTRVGILQYQDASAIHIEVHIRLHTPYRGQGIGAHAIAWLTDHLFQKYPEKHRVEGWTRVDNVAMRRAFLRCGYIKEAHLRDDFPAGNGTFRDKIGYGILRRDWQRGVTTPVRWDDASGMET